MDWQNKKIHKSVLSLVISVLLALVFLALFIGGLSNGEDSGIVICLLGVAFFAVVAWCSYKELIENKEEYKHNVENNVFGEMKRLVAYNSYEEMKARFDFEQQNTIFRDDYFVITENFLYSIKKDWLFPVEGILDAKAIMHKTNFVIDYVSVNILYCDGKCYEVKINRPLGFHDMKYETEVVEYVVKTVAYKGVNFRKYPNYRF